MVSDDSSRRWTRMRQWRWRARGYGTLTRGVVFLFLRWNLIRDDVDKSCVRISSFLLCSSMRNDRPSLPRTPQDQICQHTHTHTRVPAAIQLLSDVSLKHTSSGGWYFLSFKLNWSWRKWDEMDTCVLQNLISADPTVEKYSEEILWHP